ncbi:MAG: RagB/SusD family nutrient uptake outer membrane protein [Bacteroidota bacterium]
MKRKILSLALFLSLTIGCSDLEEEILDETSAVGLSEKQAADGIMAPVYGRLFDLFNHTNYFAIQEISTDEAILPYRGGTDWGDNGIYIAMHQHTYTSTDPNLRNSWNFIAQGIARGLVALNELPANKDPNVSTYLAEARGMIAFYSMLSLDLFGLIFVKDDLAATSKILRGNEAVEHIKKELLAAEPNLSTSVGPGRMTKAAAWGLLARLHLNAAVYRDVYADSHNFTSEDMDKVIEYCDKVLATGQYSLSPDYFAVFGNDNHTNPELIFALDQRFDIPGAHNRMSYFSLSGDQFPLTAFPNANGTDGPAITPTFYKSWTDAYGVVDPAVADPRFHQQNLPPAPGCYTAANYKINRGILRGQQYGLLRVGGAFVKCPNGDFKVDMLYNATRNKPALPVNFTEQVDFTVAGSDYSTGYRVEKYEFSRKSDSGRNKGEADIIFLRLADIFMMKAEAKLRKGDASGALAEVNTVRASRTLTTPPPALVSMDLDVLFRERGFEFYWEMQRRTDMIRFGKYEGTWTEKTNNDKTKRLFPIPQTAVDGASNIPGYLVQNQGY